MWLNQTIFPDYRHGFIEELRKRLDGDLILSGGKLGFLPGLMTPQHFEREFRVLPNRYLFKRNLLWQGGLFNAAKYNGVLVTEFNLRTISTLLLAELRSRRGLPVVFWGHVTGRKKHALAKSIRRLLLSRCDGFICYTNSQARQLASEYPDLKIWVAPNAICRSDECLEHSDEEKNILDIIYVGRLSKEKKPELLLRAFAEALGRKLIPCRTRLIVCGDGPERALLSSLASMLCVDANVVFAGHVTGRQQLGRWYAKALFSVSPGYVGLSATQSFSFGVPMVIAEGEDHSPEIEACLNGENCVFFQSNIVASLADCFGAMFKNKKLWIQKRAEIAKRLRSSYTYEKMVDAFVQVEAAFRQRLKVAVTKRTIKICLYWNYFQAYHSARLKALLAEHQSRNAVILAISIQKSGGDFHSAEVAPDLGRDIHTLLPRKEAHGLLGEVAAAWALCRLLDRENPDVLFTPGYTGFPNLMALRWARKNRKAAVLMFETLEHDRTRYSPIEWVKRKLVSNYSAAFTGGPQGRAYLEKLGMPESRVFLGYDAVDNMSFASIADASRLAAAATRLRFGLPEAYFLAVGRMIEKKGFLSLIESYAMYRDLRIPRKLPLIVVGDGPEMGRLKELIKKRGLSPWVTLPGYRSSVEIAHYMALADAFIMPSIREEQWGLVVNEAMASGVPVFASDICGATPAMVIDGVTGFSFPANDRARLSELLSWASRNPETLKKMGLSARAHVANFSLDAFAQGFYDAASCALQHNVVRQGQFR
jgi:glycosyltransferase involved in cell wall biosynthesis